MSHISSLQSKARQSQLLHTSTLVAVSTLVGISIGVLLSGRVIDTSPIVVTHSAPAKTTKLPTYRASLRAHDVVVPPIVNGVAPIISRLDTKLPVVFLTIDDGASKGEDYLLYMRQRHLIASLFLADAFIAGHYDYYKPYVEAGFIIENHTVSHDLRLFRAQGSYVWNEICGMSTIIEREYGKRPQLYRAPGGASSPLMQSLAADCGMRAVVSWRAKVDGGAVQYQEGSSLKPGDIVIMHFRPDFKADIDAFVTAMQASGLHTERLEDWL
ncbi:polysaccharide deacetylase family protein [Candidatus Saccharibacteria bacterium]|nr:MAG: polysaccharide deacetylase family protein [Candidatus Saccharibacteria bacterium]